MISPNKFRIRSLIMGLLFAGSVLLAHGDDKAGPKDTAWLLPAPEVEADPRIPKLAQVVGHRWGQDISSHGEIERYCHALAKAAPDRCRVVKYGQTYQGKDLNYLVITAPENFKSLETIRTRNLALADPRVTSTNQAAEIAARAPAVVWLAYCIHGNEASPSDAALLTAYHLLADRRAQTRELLEKLVVVIDPVQNPDGRDRFVHYYRDRRGSTDQDHPLAADRLEQWPGGRFNHYLFDMNRDWYLQTQKESVARVAAFLHWKPQIFVDAHEMGADSSFFFDPSGDPYNPHVLGRQKDWQTKIGRYHAELFDRHGFAYTTREMFDGFGPQYGSTWPILHGSVAFLWEQAGVRGRVIAREDATKLFYHDGVRHHYVSGLATLEAAARDRQQLLLDFHKNAADSVALGESGPIRAFYLLEGTRPARTAALARLLQRNGIEVRRTSAGGKVQAADTVSQATREHAIPANTFLVALNQPASRLALTLLERHQAMGADYIKRQEERVKRGLPDEFYDVTAWSLPLAFDVPCLASAAAPLPAEPWRDEPGPGSIVGKRPRIGYVLSGADDTMLPALTQWLAQGLRVNVFSEPTKINGVAFPRGSLLLRVADNPEKLHDAVAAAVKAHGLTVHAVDSAFVDEGAGLGGPYVHWVRPPRVVLAVDRPAGHEVGHTWHAFDQLWRYPVTRVAGRALPALDWHKFDVAVLPNGDYKGPDAPNEDVVRRLKDWVHEGGTLILVGGAAEWATGDKVKLLPTKLETRPSPDPKPKPAPEKKEEKEQRDKRMPVPVPGAFVKAKADDEHFVTWGLGTDPVLLYNGNRLFAPLKEEDGRNLVTVADTKDVLVSGYCWPETLTLLQGKPYVMYQALGRGHVIAFADDPTFRAFSPPLQRLFFNSVFFSLPTKREVP